MVAGVEVPAVGMWQIVPDHTYVGFSARRLGVSWVRGWFTSLAGYVDVTEDPSQSSVEAIISTASVDSGSTDRDERLRSAENLDVARHPTAVFRSTDTRWDGRSGRITGQLTLVGVTNTVELQIAYRGTVVDPWGAQRSAFSAEGDIDREDWGLTWNVTLDRGGVLVSRQVRVEIDVEAVRRPLGVAETEVSPAADTARRAGRGSGASVD
jgi:polyisoprenoid-binding protein YceI